MVLGWERLRLSCPLFTESSGSRPVRLAGAFCLPGFSTSDGPLLRALPPALAPRTTFLVEELLGCGSPLLGG
ncbi:hypothetical protein KNE206_30200 [Kitasatospora sp. NE20-6]